MKKEKATQLVLCEIPQKQTRSEPSNRAASLFNPQFAFANGNSLQHRRNLHATLKCKKELEK